jgi:hypothetical protein
MELKTPIPQSVMDSLNDYIANQIPTPYALPYKTYVALLTQTGTSAPTATVLENTLGFTPTWTYVGVGGYGIATTFDANKTTALITNKLGYSTVGYYGSSYFLLTVRNAAGTAVDGGAGVFYLSNSMIEIRVYP